jgi:cytochrome c-type biogenesis protein CcmE
VLRKKRFLIGGITVFLAIGYLVFMGFQDSVTYYYTVSELMEQGSSIYDENVRVKGQVAPGSVEQEATGRILRFTIIDGEESLSVTYQGAVPDTFKVGAEVIVEGQFNSNGIFQAHTLMPKCPSRYVPQQ